MLAIDRVQTASASLMLRRRSAKRVAFVKTTRERADERRREKLELVRQQVDSGSLVIRQMTAEERLRYPVRPAQPKRRWAR